MRMIEFPHEFADVRMRLPEETSRRAGLVLLRTGVSRAKPNYDVGPKMIECHSLHFVLEGRLQLLCEAGTYALQAGDAFCLFPRLSYRYRTADPAAPLSLAWAAFDGPQASDAAASIGFAPDAPVLRGIAGPPARALLAELHGGADGFGSGAADNPYASLIVLYQLFARLYDERRFERGAARDWVASAAAYIELHYAENLRVEWLAERAGVHRSHFSAAFARAYGLSPKRYLTKLRMTKAAELLLRHPSLAIHDLALTVGYPDVFAFTRAFVGYHGIAPSAYRKRRLPG